jgi:hypothetical protein
MTPSNMSKLATNPHIITDYTASKSYATAATHSTALTAITETFGGECLEKGLVFSTMFLGMAQNDTSTLQI